ncbi:hypothetical protein ICMP_499 [Candidatus Ishikawaella capsulata Mpkobe]|uniref:Uncharacterized protein n=1 Tax=Candidatus Ishikawaella capsulata Mpkobe TaxID=476281 RepID=C5WDE0_9ENTR|nr:hypothetical protein ICMP_499 [Candidatus Ishikawaella capsulata Mpkobe]
MQPLVFDGKYLHELLRKIDYFQDLYLIMTYKIFIINK